MKDLHEKGAKLAHVDSNGLTPLHHAARLGRKEVVKYIVDNSENYNNVKYNNYVIMIPFHNN